MARIALACISCFAFTTGRSHPPDRFSVEVVPQIDLPTPGAGVAVAWSEDGSRVAVASDYGSVLSIWDRSGQLVNRIRRDGGGPTLEGSLAFVENSSKLVFPPPGAANSGRLVILDSLSGATITEIRAYEDSKYGVVSLGVIAGSPTGDLILTGVSSGALHGGEYYNTREQRAWDNAMSSTEAVRVF